jgi:hypothetical protein
MDFIVVFTRKKCLEFLEVPDIYDLCDNKFSTISNVFFVVQFEIFLKRRLAKVVNEPFCYLILQLFDDNP